MMHWDSQSTGQKGQFQGQFWAAMSSKFGVGGQGRAGRGGKNEQEHFFSRDYDRMASHAQSLFCDGLTNYEVRAPV